MEKSKLGNFFENSMGVYPIGVEKKFSVYSIMFGFVFFWTYNVFYNIYVVYVI